MGSICMPELDARSRRLDELFASEPYLSATMRASRLHEKEDASFTPEQAGSLYASSQGTALPPENASESKVTRLGFVVSVRQEPLGLRADISPEDSGDVMTPSEAAQFLRIGEGTLRRWVRDLRLPSAHVGRSRRFRKSALLRWLRNRETAR